MRLFTSRPALRWSVPVGVAALVLAAGAASSVLAANADGGLPPRSAAQLLVDVQNAGVDGMSGTVVWQSDLGLPEIPGTGKGSSRLSSLVSGSHTLRVWYSGPDKARIALLGTLGESDTIRNGNDLWMWSSESNTATHHRISPSETDRDHQPPGEPKNLPKTPQEAAEQALKALDPSTKVTTNGTARVAGRDAYELVLTPRDSASLVGEVRVAIDGKERVPLRVQVFGKQSGGSAAEPAFEVAFTRVSFDRPGDEHFTFTPPRGAKVVEAKPGDRERKPSDKAHDGARPDATTVVGNGWTSVLVMRDVKLSDERQADKPRDDAKRPQRHAPRGSGSDGDALKNMLGSLPRVEGPWGSGRLLRSHLFSVLLTDDGRMLVGAVSPERLYEVAADPKAAPVPEPKATR